MKKIVIFSTLLASCVMAHAVSNNRIYVEPNQFMSPCEYVGFNIATALQINKLFKSNPSSTAPFQRISRNPNLQGVDLNYLLNYGTQIEKNEGTVQNVALKVTAECVAQFVQQ